MYVGVIRGDMPGPIWIGDLESASQTNFPTEPVGQKGYLTRPNATVLTNYLGGLDANYDNTPYQGSGGVPAGIESTSAVTFPVTLTGSNNTLSIAIVAGTYVSYTVAAGTYPNMKSLLAAITAALGPSSGATVTTDTNTGTLFILCSKAIGVGAYIGINLVGTSTINTILNMGSAASHFQMPTAASIITAMLPVGGPLLVTPAAILANLGAAPQATKAVACIAPMFVETTEAIQSFQVGNMSKFLKATYNPNPRLLPALANGPAITVVMNDGTTLFSAPLPIITAAVHNTPNTGDITITGVDLANSELVNSTLVRIRGASPAPGVQMPVIQLAQKLIVATNTGGTQGVVTPTSIVIPASLLTTAPPGKPFPPVAPTTYPSLGVAGSVVSIQFTSLNGGNYGTAATLASVANGQLVTLTGLANMTTSNVGGQLTISGAATTSNNGTFLITAYVSASSVVVLNPNAIVPDTNNGSLVWSTVGKAPFTVT